MPELRIGFIGCGGIAGAHLTRLATLKGVELVACCDVVEEKARKVSQTYGGQVFTDFRKMLDEVTLDACFICVPPFAHVGQELYCVEKGIPFFVEKPVALSLENARRVEKAVQEKKLITAVGYVLRALDVVDRAVKFLENKELGLVRGKYFGGVPGAGKGWYSQRKLSGGQLVEQATHTVDMMRYLTGEVVEVFGYAFAGINKRLYSNYDVEDASTAVMRFSNGAIGNISCTWLWTGYHSSVEIIGKGVTVTLEGGTLTIDSGDRKTIYVSRADPMLVQDTLFIEAVKYGRPERIKADYRQGVRSLAVSLSILESFRTGKPVKVPGE